MLFRASSLSTSNLLALFILAICVLMNALARGISETYAVFLLPLSQEFGAARADISSVYSVYMLVHGICAPGAGWLFDRFGPRVCYGLGIMALGVGYLLAGRLNALWQFYLCVGVLGGIGVAAMGMVPASALVSRWFGRRLATAMGITYAGLGFGVIAVVPMTQWFIGEYGWRAAYTALGGGLLVLLPIVLLLPWARLARGSVANRTRASTRSDSGIDARLSDALCTRAFWGLFAVFFFTGIAIYATVLQVVVYLIESGFSPLRAATAFGFLGALSTFGMLISGALADRYGRRLIVCISFLLTIGGIAALFVVGKHGSNVALVAFVLSFGLSQGSRGPIVSTLCASLFSGRGIGAIYGAITLGMGVGAAIGSWMSGVLHDLTGGYEAGFVFAAVCALLGLAQFWWVPALREAR